jgi:putative transposase
MLTEWKRSGELGYLNEVSSVPLQQALLHLQGAFASSYGKRARYPRFKSRRASRQAAEYTRSAFRWRDGRLTLAKMDAPLEIRWSRPLPEGAEPSTATVSRDAAGRWHVSLLCECAVEPLPAADAVTGIDAGLARAISDAAWSDLRSMLEYECDWYGRDLIVIDRWYPSSKTCSACGHTAASLPLTVREWDCANCGTRHHRDINAAINIRAAGLAVSACGGSVRPKRETSRAGSSR